jgi:hypothetical protein
MKPLKKAALSDGFIDFHYSYTRRLPTQYLANSFLADCPVRKSSSKEMMQASVEPADNLRITTLVREFEDQVWHGFGGSHSMFRHTNIHQSPNWADSGQAQLRCIFIKQKPRK